MTRVLCLAFYAAAAVLIAGVRGSLSLSGPDDSSEKTRSALDKARTDAAAAGLLDWVSEAAIPGELKGAATSSPDETRLFVLFAYGLRQHKCIANNTTVAIRTKAVLYGRPGDRLGDLADQPLQDDFPPLKAVGIYQDFSAANQGRSTHLWELRLFKSGVDKNHISTIFNGAVRGEPADILRNAELGSSVREALFADNSAARGEFVPVGESDANPDYGQAVFRTVPPDVDPASTLVPKQPGSRQRSVLGNREGIMNDVRHVIRLPDAVQVILECNPQDENLVEEQYSVQFHFYGVQNQNDQPTKRRRRRRDEI